MNYYYTNQSISTTTDPTVVGSPMNDVGVDGGYFFDNFFTVTCHHCIQVINQQQM
jgi:hypothetical protein